MNRKVVILVVLMVVLVGLAAYVLMSGGDSGTTVPPAPQGGQPPADGSGVQAEQQAAAGQSGVQGAPKAKPANAYEPWFKAQQVKYDMVERLVPPVLADRLAPPVNENGIFVLMDPFKDHTPVRRGTTGGEPAPLDRLVEQFKLGGITTGADGKPSAFFRNVPLPFHEGDYLGDSGFKIVRIRAQVTPEERKERLEPEVEVENYQKQKYIFTLPSPLPPRVDQGAPCPR